MHTVRRTIDIKVELTPLDLARTFCNYDADEQAKFFEYIAQISLHWEHHLCFQLGAVSNSGELTTEGKRVMQQIGEYGE